MASGIIFYIMIFAVVYHAVKKKKAGEGRSVPNRPRATQAKPNYQPRTAQAKPNYQPRTAQAKPNHKPAKGPYSGVYAGTRSWGDSQAGQRELKQRLQQKYGSYPKGKERCMADDILESAKSNVDEYAADTVLVRMGGQGAEGLVMPEKEAEHFMDSTPDAGVLSGQAFNLSDLLAVGLGAESENMRRLNDLMIMGYQGSLTFERDFIAEGVEMLNSYHG